MSHLRRILSGLLAAGLAAGCSARTPVASTTPGARLAGAVDLGELPPDEELDAVIALSLPEAPRLRKFLAAQDVTRDVLTPYDFGEQFGASALAYARVVAWLGSSGLTVTRTSPARTTITVHGTVAALERAFATPLHQFEDSSGRFSAAISELTVPGDLGADLDGVAGLEGGLPWESHLDRPAAWPNAPAPGEPAPFTPADLEKLYNSAAITTPGAGQTVVILGTGFAPNVTDLQAYFDKYKPYGEASRPVHYTTVQVGGANRDSISAATNEQVENTLDAEMLLALAPDAQVVHVLTATNTPGLFTDGISYIVNQLQTAHAVTVSYGTCERGAAGSMPVVHAMLAQAKAQGQTWFFASGDSGSDGCRNGTSNKVFSAGWPASAPFAIGVGGTQIDTTSNTEVVWNTNPGSTAFPAGGSGGGASETLPKPDYQIGVTPNDSARDEPDISALAGPPEVAIYISGFNLTDNTAPVGGTSASAPMWAGIWALLSQAHPTLTINNAHERIYALGKAGGVFHDIVSGNNGGPGGTATGGNPATPGYDLATGWGTPDVAALLANW
jgi:kumamolisin